MIDKSDAARVIDYLKGAGFANLKDADPATWADALNVASMVSGESKPKLSPRPDELMDAARVVVVEGVKFPQVSDLVKLIRANRADHSRVRNERVRVSIAADGPLVPEGLGGDVELELSWRRHAVNAIADGTPRDKAEELAYTLIGRARPALPAARGDIRSLVRQLTEGGE